jgi:hypothetical protein
MSDVPADVAAFFESYRAAFERYDSGAIADLFGYPAHVTSDGGEVGLLGIATREDWVPQLDRLLRLYRSLGVHSARVIEASASTLSDRLVQATVRWALDDAGSRCLYSFEATYTLARIGGALRITAIAHDELPRYQEALARLRSAAGHEDGRA